MHLSPRRRVRNVRARAQQLLMTIGLLIVAGCQSTQSPRVSVSSPAIKAASTPDSTRSRATANASTPQSKPNNPKVADVTRTAVDVFGDSGTTVSVPESAGAGPTWDMDVRSYESQERVAFYVNFFTQNSRARFQERLHLGTRYEPMIRAKLRAGGIPEDMSYLALVESGFDPNAYSSAAAVGMWQFMSSTARDVGLRVDWWVDERRDPARSTDAAVRFIHDLQMQFGSLYLAAAAYNGGPGRVSRGLTRFAEDMAGSEGEDRFFALAEHDYLRSETKNYVPQIIAAALVGKEPVRYGFSFDTLSEYAYDSVQVEAGTPLATVARASATGLGVIKELNPAVLRGMTPPVGSMWIRVPTNCAVLPDQISANLASLPPEDRVGFHSVKSTGSESTAGLASQSGVTSRELALYNPGLKTTKKGKVLAGQTVLIPTAFAIAGATNVPDPSIEHYGTSTLAATKSGAVHIVKRGESMATIAAHFNLTVGRLKSLNGIRGNRVVAGQALRVKALAPATHLASTKSAGSKSNRESSSPKATTVAARKPAAKSAAPTKLSGHAAATKKSVPHKITTKHAAKPKQTVANNSEASSAVGRSR